MPTKGSCRRKVNTTGKKSLHCEMVRHGVQTKGKRKHPKRFKNPNVSTIIPMNGYLKNTSKIPPRKHTVPRNFCLRAKK